MELTNAINLLGVMVTNKSQEIDSLTLAIKILQDNFQPELTRMVTAEKQVTEMNEANIALTTRATTAEEQVIGLQKDKETLHESLTNAQVLIDSKVEDIKTLNESLDKAQEDINKLTEENETLKQAAVELTPIEEIPKETDLSETPIP